MRCDDSERAEVDLNHEQTANKVKYFLDKPKKGKFEWRVHDCVQYLSLNSSAQAKCANEVSNYVPASQIQHILFPELPILCDQKFIENIEENTGGLRIQRVEIKSSDYTSQKREAQPNNPSESQGKR